MAFAMDSFTWLNLLCSYSVLALSINSGEED